MDLLAPVSTRTSTEAVKELAVAVRLLLFGDRCRALGHVGAAAIQAYID